MHLLVNRWSDLDVWLFISFAWNQKKKKNILPPSYFSVHLVFQRINWEWFIGFFKISFYYIKHCQFSPALFKKQIRIKNKLSHTQITVSRLRMTEALSPLHKYAFMLYCTKGHNCTWISYILLFSTCKHVELIMQLLMQWQGSGNELFRLKASNCSSDLANIYGPEKQKDVSPILYVR